MTITAHILQVFVDAHGCFGDKASVVIDEGKHIPDRVRQEVARKLNTGETIFINNSASADISVMHSQGEIGFAGVAVLGAAWLVTDLRQKPTESLRSRDGVIIASQAEGVTWARASLHILPPWHLVEMQSVAEVEQLNVEDMKTVEHTLFWAWIDETNGIIRGRTFASDWDIPEAEGNGSGAMVLAAKLGKHIELRHGRGSVMFARPAPGASAEIGGQVIQKEAVTLSV